MKIIVKLLCILVLALINTDFISNWLALEMGHPEEDQRNIFKSIPFNLFSLDTGCHISK